MRSPPSRVTATTNFGDSCNRSRSGPPVGVAGGDATFAEFGQYGGVVDAQVFAYSGEGPAEVVEVDRVVDLLGGKAASARRVV